MKAPLGGEATGPNPTDRGKSGTKWYLSSEGHALPIGFVVTGANRHNETLLEAVLGTRAVLSFEAKQHLCADSGYDFGERYAQH